MPLQKLFLLQKEQQLMPSVSGQTQELQDRARRGAAVQHQPFSALHNCACAFFFKKKGPSLYYFKHLAMLLFPLQLHCVQQVTNRFATILSVG